MSLPDNNPGTSPDRSVKTIAIRLEPDIHAQLSLIAQLRGNTITDEIRAALTAHIESIKSLPEVVARADDVLDAIEREALARREAIATLFGTAPGSETTTSEPNGSRSRKPRQHSPSSDAE